MDITGVYSVYLVISVAMTIWVGRTLYRNGRIFLIDAFHNNEEMADSVNHLLVVGFYLINFGFVSLFLRFGTAPESSKEIFEYISFKFGVILIILGGMHFFNMFNFARMRSKAKRRGKQRLRFDDEGEYNAQEEKTLESRYSRAKLK